MRRFPQVLPALLAGYLCFFSSLILCSADDSISCDFNIFPGRVFTLNHDGEPVYMDIPVNNENLKIGLLIQSDTSVEARNGAVLALDEVNQSGGFLGRNFELIVKTMEGTWGTGSKQAVDMIFADKVLAIVGSHDGRNAHLVEQASTKANITFLSAWAGDPTLAQAFTPWFFNCVPDDNQQGEMLALEISRKKYKNITLVTDNDYDARSAFRSFSMKCEAAGTARPVSIVYNKNENGISEITDMIAIRNTDCLVLFTEPATADKIISRLKEVGYSSEIYGTLHLIREFSRISDYPEVMKNLQLLITGDWYKKGRSDFAGRYFEKFRKWPGPTASFSYDAMKMMIKAVIDAGGNRDGIQKALLTIDYYGATGKIRFDEKGRRICTTVPSE